MAQSPSLTERGIAIAVCSGHGGVSCLGALRIGPGLDSHMRLSAKEIGSRLGPLADLPASGSASAPRSLNRPSSTATSPKGALGRCRRQVSPPGGRLDKGRPVRCVYGVFMGLSNFESTFSFHFGRIERDRRRTVV